MAQTLTIARSFGMVSEAQVPGLEDVTGDTAVAVSVSVPGAGNVTLSSLYLKSATLKALTMYCDQDVVVTFSGPAFTVVAGDPWVWTESSGIAYPFGGTCTGSVTVSNAGSTAANFELRLVASN